MAKTGSGYLSGILGLARGKLKPRGSLITSLSEKAYTLAIARVKV